MTVFDALCLLVVIAIILVGILRIAVIWTNVLMRVADWWVTH